MGGETKRDEISEDIKCYMDMYLVLEAREWTVLSYSAKDHLQVVWHTYESNAQVSIM